MLIETSGEELPCEGPFKFACFSVIVKFRGDSHGAFHYIKISHLLPFWRQYVYLHQLNVMKAHHDQSLTAHTTQWMDHGRKIDAKLSIFDINR